MTSPARARDQDPASVVGMDWFEMPAEAKIKRMLEEGGHVKWGWVFYRTCYAPGLGRAWDRLKDAHAEDIHAHLSASKAPEIAESFDPVFVSDPELEGASADTLKARFRRWARAEEPGVDGMRFHGSRYTYFVLVDEEALGSIDGDAWGHGGVARGRVKVVRAWQDPPERPADDALGHPVDVQDVIKVPPRSLDVDLYVELNNEDRWYAQYYERQIDAVMNPDEDLCTDDDFDEEEDEMELQAVEAEQNQRENASS